ncbi:MAG: hypothetical protein LBJ47_02330 [Tannerella sp.]|jgi:hypothetical protein|nr:hypothetical protein [Tannerella sp.]
MVISKWMYTVCPVREKMLVETFSETFKLRAVRYGMSVELVPVIRPVSGRNVNKNDMTTL